MTNPKHLSVWSPYADRVLAQIRGQQRPLQRTGERGWWSLELSGDEHQEHFEYAFVVEQDGRSSPPVPDPRSLYQPHGVHGRSRFVDLGAHVWSDDVFQQPPLGSGLIYELHIGTFTSEGTFLAAIDRLEHLVDLEVTHVELMPVNTFPGDRGWGYDGVALFAPHPAYCRGPDGVDVGPRALQTFVEACHQRGLAVLLDVVYNHLGPSGNYLGVFGPYFTERYQTPWGSAVNLDGPGSDEVRAFFVDNALMWMRDYRIDGLRLDAVHAFRDFSALHFLQQLRDETRRLERQLGRRLVLIAESDLSDPRMVRGPEVGGHGMDAQWADEVHHAVHAVLTGEQDGYYADFGAIAQLAKACKNPFVYDGQYSPHRQHRHGASPTGLDGDRFVVFTQNHDQVGNRARGDRLTQLVGLEASWTALAIILCSPYVPMLFMGEEWGSRTPFQYFTSHEEEELAEAVRKGRRAEFAAFGWQPEDVPDPQERETFETSKLDWSDLDEPLCSAYLERTKRLIRLRRTEPDLADARRDQVSVQHDETNRWILLQRRRIVLVAHLGQGDISIEMGAIGPMDLLLGSPAVKAPEGETIRLGPWSVGIFRRLNTEEDCPAARATLPPTHA